MNHAGWLAGLMDGWVRSRQAIIEITLHVKGHTSKVPNVER